MRVPHSNCTTTPKNNPDGKTNGARDQNPSSPRVPKHEPGYALIDADFASSILVSIVLGSAPLVLISMRRALVSSRFGNVTRKTPLRYSATAPSAETLFGKVNERVKLPYDLSTR